MIKKSSQDRNLLLGLLALKNRFIEPALLLKALKVWEQNRSKPLNHLLIEWKAMNPNQLGLLHAMVEMHLEHQGEEAGSQFIASNLSGSVEDVIQALEAQETASAKGASNTRELDESAPTLTIDPDRTPTLSDARYQVVRPHARGALGKISVARDRELNREVAIKEIHPDKADEALYRSRFRQEAQINGRLEHPNIVPVYSFGTHSDGRPYYAMRLIRGQSLQEAIDQFHQKPLGKLPGTERELEFRELLQRFLDVCNAIAYAHSRGVLHRDIKPANIMLGAYGETLVVDWGLARAVEGLSEPSSELDQPISPSSDDSDSSPNGEIIGTFEYMSPEQATNPNNLDTATDVYGLGATLYTLVTGKPPFPYRENILKRIRLGLFPPPRQANKDVPPALEAICLKAMALEPKKRYGSARDLAADIKFWLADLPVTACRDPLPARVSRWLQRHRTLAKGMAVLLLTGLLALGIGLVLLKGEKDRADLLMQKAQRQADIAGRADYRNKILLAQEEWNKGRAVQAWDQLKSCPPQYRGWEHAYLVSLFRRLPSFHGTDTGKIPISMDYSADGKRFAKGHLRGILDIWELEGNTNHYSFPAHADAINFVRFLPDGKRLVTACKDGSIKIWDTVNRTETVRLKGHPASIECLTISQDGNRIASGSEDGTLKIWDASSGSELVSITADVSALSAVAFHPKNPSVATGSAGGILKIWDTLNPAKEMTLKGSHAGRVTSIAFSADGKRLATGSFDQTVKLWDAERGIELHNLTGHPDGVNSVAFSANGKRLVSVTFNQDMKIWDAESGTEIMTLLGQSDLSSILSLHPLGKRLVPGSLDPLFQVWDETTAPEARLLEKHINWVTCMAFSPDGTQIISGGKDQKIILWNAATGKEIWTQTGHDSPVTCLAFSPDGTHIISGAKDNKLILWNRADGRKLQTFRGHTNQVTCVAFSPDGKTIVSGAKDNNGDKDNTLILWNAQNGWPIRHLKGHQDQVRCLAFSPDGKTIASGGRDNLLILWNAHNGISRAIRKEHSGPITRLAFSPDGSTLASGSQDSRLILWNAQSGEPIHQLQGHTAAVTCLAFSPDGSLLVSGGGDKKIKAWSLPDGKERFTLKGHQQAIDSLFFTPQGDRIISGGRGTLKVWDAQDGKETLSLTASQRMTFGLIRSPDGKRLAAGGNDNRLQIWDASNGDCPYTVDSD